MNTTCPYCGVGCGVVVKNGVLTGDPAHPSTHGRLCAKGVTLMQTLDDSARLTMPMIGGRIAEWEEALDVVTARFTEAIAEHGPDSVAFYVSGQFLTEDYYVANKLMKGFIGGANIDTNSRLCMASTVAGQMRAFGEDVVPGCYEDIDEADLLVFTGSNAAWCHPVLFERAMAAQARGTKIVVIDPRKTASTALADLHLAIKPDTDTALFNLLLVTLQDRGLVDSEYVANHTEGFATALAAARNSPRDAAYFGVSDADLQTFLDWFCGTERSVTLFSQGVHQSISGTDKVNAIINVHLASGRIGKPGMGPFSLTGQPNAMGGREVGGFANQLAAHLHLEDADERALVREFWNAPALPEAPGLKAVELFEAVRAGKIKAIWIACTNPAFSMPNASTVRAALEACPFVVAADCWPTDTTRLATVVLPASGWGEKNGTATNSERMISRQRAFRAAPGQAKPDWWMFTEIARRMGFAAEFPYTSAADIFREHAALSGFGNGGKRLFDIGALAALSDDGYDQLGAVRWPCPVSTPPVKRFFAEGGFSTPSKRAQFIPITPSMRRPDPGLPFTLNTGRLRDQWHGMTRTGIVPALMENATPSLALSPVDAERLGVAAGDLLRITTRQGSTVLPAAITPSQRPGEVFAAMHWTSAFSSADAIDRLIGPVADPHSGQPAYKNEPAAIEALPALWHGILQSRHCPSPKGEFSWSRAPVAGGMHRLHLAGWQALPPGDELADWAARLCSREAGGADAECERIELVDAGRGIYRLALLRGAALQACLFIARTRDALPGTDAINALFAVTDWQQSRAAILQARISGEQNNGRIVCLCHGVRDTTIRAAIKTRRLSSIAGIGQAVQAGTNCGSCKGELAELLQAERLHADLQPA
jgi:assimilatory nitrate reductase catalytic subunit